MQEINVANQIDDQKIVQVIGLLWQLKDVVDMKNKQIDQALQEIYSNLINLSNVSNLVEIVEVGRSIFSIED